MLSLVSRLLAPKYCYEFAAKVLPYTIMLATLLSVYGLLAGLFVAPADYQQGFAVKLLYIHAPAAVLSLLLYAVVGLSSAVFLIWRIKVADLLAVNCARIGFMFCALALLTGCIWGKPMWGAWWVWDARLSSELLLLFLYVGYIAMRTTFVDSNKAAKLAAVLAIIGLIDLPIVHYSVNWWQTLHQSSSFSNILRPSMSASIWYPLLCSLLGMSALCMTLILYMMRSDILWLERDKLWVKQKMGVVGA